MKYTEALKAARRGIYVHGYLHRVAIVSTSDARLSIAMDEARQVLDASSLTIERISRPTMTIQTEKGGIFRFFRLNDRMDAYAIYGVKYPHIIMLGQESDYRQEVLEVIRAQNVGVDGDAPLMQWVDDI